MALKCGIVGLPNVGKSTLFNALSNAKAQSANFPFCTIEPNIGVISVPDTRLIELERLVNPKRVVPATMEFVDIAGLVKGASKGEGLGNKFLANIREVDAILHVVRCFEDPNIVHVDGSVDSVRDREIVDAELQLKDLETVEKRKNRVEKLSKSGDKEASRMHDLLNRVGAHLEKGESARTLEISEEEKPFFDELFLLTAKRVLYVCNVDEASVVSGNDMVDALRDSVSKEDAEVLVVCASIEADIASLDDYEDRVEFLNEIGLKESGLSRLIRSAYNLLHLITYFTAGEKEVRAWTIVKGTRAPGAAAVIHTDFERGFIRAEVIKYDDFVALGSESACREAGKLHVEGKDYMVHDGDIMHFRFNV